MSYDEEQHQKSRVVVETPTARREEVSYTHRERAPERSGYSTGMVAAVALTAIALTAFVLFFLMNDREDATNANTTIATTAPTPIPTAQTPIIIQQPAQQAPPVIIEQPATTQPAPVIITPPAPGTTAAPPAAATANTGLDDATIESQINRAFTDDPELSTLGITVTVIDGKATLIGSVATPAMKSRIERLAKAVRGVRTVENKITVEGSNS